MRGPALPLAKLLCLCGVAAQQPEVAQDPVATAQQVLASAVAVHGAESIPAAAAQLALGRELFRNGDAAAAAAAARAALAVLEQHGREQELAAADALLLLGACAGLRNDLATAATFYRRALTIRERRDEPGAPYLQQLRLNLAMSLQAMTDHPAALELAMAGLADVEQKQGPDSLAAGSFQAVVALCLDGLGRYQEAFEHYQRAEQILRATRGEAYPDTLRMAGLAGVMSCRMGRAEEGLGRLAAAIAAMRKAPQVRPDLLAELETAEVVLRVVHVGDEASCAALRSSLAKSMNDTRGDPDGTRVLLLMSVLSHVDPAAIDLGVVRQAIARCEGLGADPLAVAMMRATLWRKLYGDGERDEAARSIQRALTVLDDSPWFVGLERWKIPWGMAAAHWHAGDNAAALPLLRRCIAELPRLLDAWSSPLDERQRLEVTSCTRKTVDLLLTIAAETDASAAERWQSVLAWKGLVSRGLLQSLQWLRKNLDPQTQRLTETLHAAVGRWSALARCGAADELVAAARRERESIERALAQRLVSRAAGAPEPETVALALGADEVLVDFFSYGHLRRNAADQVQVEERLLAFVVRRGRAPVLVELGPLDEITDSVVAFLQVGSRWTKPVAGGPAIVAAAGKRVADRVWAPLGEWIPAGARVLICPDSVMALVPFACLPGRVADTFLLEEHEFVYVACAGDVIDRTIALPDGQPSLLAVGDVDYGNREAIAGTRAGLRDFSPLAGSGPEIDTIAALFGPSGKGEPMLLRRADATIERLARHAAGATFVHIATHGWFSGSRALPDPAQRWQGFERAGIAPDGSMAPGAASGLAFAGANRPADAETDGVLTADEIALLDLGHCELAVLSACETALGTVSAGDGLLGLRRSLRLAGAKRSLTTVWRVDDAATLRCMQAFYRELWPQRQPPAAALRAAQRAMLEAARAETGQALVGTWGAFVLEAR